MNLVIIFITLNLIYITTGKNLKVNSIETFVFVDIETTGLRQPNITELAMWITPRNCLLDSQDNMNCGMLNKWTMLFNPGKGIERKASEITGLNNDMLDKYDKFDERAGTNIISYLSHYPRPICLIAHNGKRYDFPLIKKTFDKIQLTVPNYILYSDSLQILRELENEDITKTKKKSFKLEDIYERLFHSKPVVTHAAEADVEVLYKIALFYGSDFIDIAEKFASRFSEIDP